ncbi:HET-domain-containing protein [Ophiobolus disseminans]|uniref:HET-domain-containing protein n=1 Tax=Ophiobolus disseminans TaxID=1469910 RepID=A0A6A6ZV25_9PLEO|nr:HET-domain-containing protein [Ophiobolus disseminans]
MKTHKQCRPQNNSIQTALPTRLIDVGTLKYPELRLCVPKEEDSFRYGALSYCWGKLTEDDKHKFCTTKDNFPSRQRGINEFILPKTHRDAVWICRNLGIEYLWIDSHCIIQLGDNGDDWKHEAQLMEEVYSSAYCVLAAASATSVNAGFLDQEVNSEYIYARDHSDRRLYVSTNVEDFDQHVEEGPLNKRPWVLQERYPARRTLHFAADQVYWECGEEMYCGNLAQLRRRKIGRGLASDPYFPSTLTTLCTFESWNFIRSLLENYSKRELAEPNDRRYAVSGLGERLARVLTCGSSYGVFEKYLYRNLLWYLVPRKNDETKSILLGHDIPSWSWMAYSGGIKFVKIPFGGVSWIKHDYLKLKERDGVITADLGEIPSCTTRPCEERHVLVDAGVERGWIQYDVEGDEEPYATLHALPYQRLLRLYNKDATRSDRKPPNYRLSDEQDLAFERYLDAIDAIGYGIHRGLVTAQAYALMKESYMGLDEAPPPLGKNWGRRWLKRHPKYRRVKAKPIEEPEALRGWFNLLESFTQKLGIQPEDLYNMDETGCRIGVATNQYVYMKNGRQVFIPNANNRKLITLVPWL